MKLNRTILIAIIVIIAIIAVIMLNIGLPNNTDTLTNNDSVTQVSDLKEYDFDSYFAMNIPKTTTFEKTNGTENGEISLYINYKDPSETINVIYAESIGGAEKLIHAYEDMAQDNANITIKKVNNVTIIHLNDDNSIGENDYHDLAVAGDNDRYVLMQCNNESLMSSMAQSLKFK